MKNGEMLAPKVNSNDPNFKMVGTCQSEDMGKYGT